MRRMKNKRKKIASFMGAFLCVGIAFLMMFLLKIDKVEAYTISDSGEKMPRIVSMGDSFSSGEGIEPFYDDYKSNKEKVKSFDYLAHRSEKSWPGMLKFPGLDKMAREYKGTNWFFVASSGAETKHLIYEQKKEYSVGVVGQYSGTKYLPPQLEIFDELEKNSVDYVTITIGGNDAGFATIVQEAYMGSTYLNTSGLSDMLSKTWKSFYRENGIRDKIYESYKDIEEAAGAQAQIIVAGYPHLLDPDGRGMMISKEEATEINRAVSNFNLEIERIVEHCADEGMKICFVSVEEEFEGHEAYSKNNWIHKVYPLNSKEEDLENFTMASAYSMHPTYDGAIAYAQCVNRKIEELAEAEEKQLEQEALNPTDKEREVVLVLDNSGSMNGQPMDETKTAAYKFVNTVLDAGANIGIVSYSSSAQVCSARTDSQDYLDKAIGSLYTGGGTNIESGLRMADGMLSDSKAKKKIIVLMSDGEANEGMVGEELINYAEELKEKGYYIYTLGFFSALPNPANAQKIMGGIASEGCHYEVSDAESLVFFFGDIADQISGEEYIYIRIACPVDVTVSYKGEEMSSKNAESNVRTSFGSMTFEENEDLGQEEETENTYLGFTQDKEDNSDTRVKILRLKEGVDYDIKIEGNGNGSMDYTIGFMDEDGEYSDMRKFSNVKITKKTKIDTVAANTKATYMYVDEDGDGKYDITYKALADSRAEIVDNTYIIYICVYTVLALAVFIGIAVYVRRSKIKKYL